jgi:Ig-like domain-containing protein
LNTWDVSNVTNMESMFAECSAFNQELGSWKLTKCERLGLEKCGMSLANYSSSLTAWAAQNDIKDGLNLVATDLKYISGVTEARNKLVNDKHWTITGDAPVDHYLNFKESSLVLKKGAEATLELIKKGVEDSETVTFTSSDATIVEIVDAATFKIKAVKEGKATLTATVAANASHGELKATCEVTVTVPVTGVTLSDTKIEVPKEKTHKLVATLQPTDASNQKVTWSTSDKDIATVAADGTVTGIKEGDATITVTTDEGKFTATCAVKVTPPTAVEDVVFATVVVAPNPFTALLRITNGELSGKYELFNAQGIVVSTGVLEKTETRVNTAALATGVYLLRLTAANGATKTITVVKEK